MTRDDFQQLVRQLVREIPDHYLEGIAAIDVSPKTIPHPLLADVYTLGECIPVHGDADTLVSRVVLYHGSFGALARRQENFVWRDEAWDTLTHELRHHLEWQADADDLEQYDWAAEQNFARLEGEPFEPTFHLVAERIVTGVYRVDDDVFIDHVVRTRPDRHELVWHGARYTVTVPAAPLPIFLTLEDVPEPPPGELVLVIRRKPGLRDLFRRVRRASEASAVVTPVTP